MQEGFIYKALSGFYYVKTSDGEIYQTRARGKFRKEKFSPLVGDEVKFESDNYKEGYLLEVKPRKNQLKRPSISNVDQALIVTSMIDPDYSDVLLDKMLVSVEMQKIRPIIYLSKVDLLKDKTNFQEISYKYQKIGYPIFSNLDDKEGLKEYFTGKLTVVMGQSGAGKSTLLNELLGQNKLAVGEISKALGRGRHTTRHTELIEIAGGNLADTPGFSSLDLQKITSVELGQYFPEIRNYSAKCKFRGCTHLHEPQCAVKLAVNNGKITESRYKNYQVFQQEIEQQNKY